MRLYSRFWRTAALRVKPLGTIETAAGANTLFTDQRNPSAAAEPVQLADQFDAYSAGYSKPAFNRAAYSDVTPVLNSSMPAATVYVSAALPGPVDNRVGDYGQEPELDVAEQLIGDDTSSFETLAANDVQATSAFAGEWVETTNGATNIGDFLRVPIDNQAYAAVLDDSDFDQAYSIDSRYMVLRDESETGDVRVMNMLLGNTAVQVALNAAGADANGNVVMGRISANTALSDLSEQLPENGAAPAEIDEKILENLARVQVLAEAQAEYEAATEQEGKAMQQAQPALQQAQATLQQRLLFNTAVNLARVEEEQE